LTDFLLGSRAIHQRNYSYSGPIEASMSSWSLFCSSSSRALSFSRRSLCTFIKAANSSLNFLFMSAALSAIVEEAPGADAVPTPPVEVEAVAGEDSEAVGGLFCPVVAFLVAGFLDKDGVAGVEEVVEEVPGADAVPTPPVEVEAVAGEDSEAVGGLFCPVLAFLFFGFLGTDGVGGLRFFCDAEGGWICSGVCCVLLVDLGGGESSISSTWI
jgi:hypothetical protein